MIRVNVLTEGQSEMFFAKRTLNKYFGGTAIFDARCIMTSKDNRTNREFRGGLTSYSHAKRDIENWLKSDTAAYITTMFDFFRLPPDFPGYRDALRCGSHEEAVIELEKALKADILSRLQDIPENRFIPYIQLHEFETLLYTDIRVLKYDYLEQDDVVKIESLYRETQDIPPEKINHGDETAPSKRLLKAINYQKGELPSEWLETITIDKIIEKCPHFSCWIDSLKALTTA